MHFHPVSGVSKHIVSDISFGMESYDFFSSLDLGFSCQLLNMLYAQVGCKRYFHLFSPTTCQYSP